MNNQQVSFYVRMAKQAHRFARKYEFGPTYRAWEQGRRDAWMVTARHLQGSIGARLRNTMRKTKELAVTA